MRRDPRSLFVSLDELSNGQRSAYFALCTEFTALMLSDRPSKEWECLPGLLDNLLRESCSRVKALGSTGCLTTGEWRHLQTRFMEEVYGSFNAVPPSLDAHLLGEQPLTVRCLVCNQAHLIPSCPIG